MMNVLKSLFLATIVSAGATSLSAEEAKSSQLESLYKQVRIQDVQENAVKMVGDDWMLITAGAPEKFNSMTASWGGFGVWNKPVAFILVHPKRYTYQLLEKEEYFTLSFYDEKYRSLLKELFGTKSGRDTDKVKESGFTPIKMKPAGMAYAEARLIVVCKKIYADKTQNENRFPPKETPEGAEFHKLYFGEIVSVWMKK